MLLCFVFGICKRCANVKFRWVILPNDGLRLKRGGSSPQGIEKFYAFIGKVDSIGDKGINVL